MMRYPKRLMGWYYRFYDIIEIRLRYAPNLFEDNAYEVYDRAKVLLPMRVIMNSKISNREDLIPLNTMVWVNPGEDDGDWIGKLANGEEIHLRPIPDNIR